MRNFLYLLLFLLSLLLFIFDFRLVIFGFLLFFFFLVSLIVRLSNFLFLSLLNIEFNRETNEL